MEDLAVSKSSAFFKLKYSTAIRIWHWLTFLFMTGSMVTVLFASTLFDVKPPKPPGNRAAPQTEQRSGETNEPKGEEPRFDPSKLDPETRAAFTYRHKIWDVHKLIGFGLCFLLLSRVFIEVRRTKEERLITRINNAVNIPVNSNEARQDKRHYLFVKRGYLVFYGLLLLMALTGLIMAFEHTPFLEAVQRPARAVHQTLQYFFYAYVLVHLIGVIRADLTKQKGIVSAMINGGN